MPSDKDLSRETHEIAVRIEEQLKAVNEHLVIINNRLNDHAGRIRATETKQERHLSDTEHLEEAVRNHEQGHPSAIRLILLLAGMITLLNGGGAYAVYKMVLIKLGG